MKNPAHLLSAALFAGALFLAAPATVRAAKSTAVAKITKVTADSVTIRNGANKGLRLTEVATDGTRSVREASNVETYKVTGATTILVNNLPAKITDLKAGMQASVRVGLDRNVAAAITAADVPPEQKVAREEKGEDGKAAPWKTRAMFTGIDSYKVRAVGTDTLTVAQDGGKKSIAFKVRPITQITVNGEKSTLGKVQVGMDVTVVASTDAQIAATVTAKDAK